MDTTTIEATAQSPPTLGSYKLKRRNSNPFNFRKTHATLNDTASIGTSSTLDESSSHSIVSVRSLGRRRKSTKRIEHGEGRYMEPVDVDSLCNEPYQSRAGSVHTGPVDVDSVFEEHPSPIHQSTVHRTLVGSSVVSQTSRQSHLSREVREFLHNIENGCKVLDEDAQRRWLEQLQEAVATSTDHTGPVDVDDYLPTHTCSQVPEIDEDEDMEGLVGYMDGCDPETIEKVTSYDLSNWNNQGGEDYSRDGSRGAVTFCVPPRTTLHKPTHRRSKSLPDTAAEV